jgi:hypothetical protein
VEIEVEAKVEMQAEVEIQEKTRVFVQASTRLRTLLHVPPGELLGMLHCEHEVKGPVQNAAAECWQSGGRPSLNWAAETKAACTTATPALDCLMASGRVSGAGP